MAATSSPYLPILCAVGIVVVVIVSVQFFRGPHRLGIAMAFNRGFRFHMLVRKIGYALSPRLADKWLPRLGFGWPYPDDVLLERRPTARDCSYRSAPSKSRRR